MKNKYIILLAPLLAFVAYTTLTSSSGGVTGKSIVGCGGGSCHGTAAATTTVISLTGLPAGGYQNNTVYSITLTISNTSITPGALGLRDGFDMTATAGSFTAITGTALNGVTEIRHSTPKAAPTGTASWTFNWTSPASGSATVTFRVAGNATNGDGSPNSLDKWNTYTTTLVGPPLAVSATASMIACNGGTSTITASGTNGTNPYQYALNTGTFQTLNTFAGNMVGTYTVTIKDAVNATATTTVTISQPTILTLNSPTITTPLCNGGTGSLTILATGGTGTKTYTINPLGPQSNTTGNFTSLTSQTYTVTVSDANSCTKTSIVAMSQPSMIIFSAGTINPPLCNGGTGSASKPASGGSGTITYTINPLGPQTNTTGNFIGLSGQIYTVTATDANSCSKTTTFAITSPTAIAFNAPSLTNPVCNGGTGSVQILANGGTGTKFYSIAPLGPQTSLTGTFNALTAQNYTISVVDANSCSLTTLVTLTQPAPITVTSANVSGCQGSAIPLVGNPAGGIYSVPNPYTGPSTSYTYSYTNGNGCTGTSSASSITVTPVNSSNIVMPGASSLCQTLTQVSGTNSYANSSCELIASIASNGLGATDACISFLTGSPSWNGEPYANRVYSITPTNQPISPATICLYYTSADLAAAGITINSDISITKVSGNGVLGGGGAVTEIPNSIMTINNLFGGDKEVCFPVTSFSSFYLHSKNTNNVALPVQLVDFKGIPTNNTDILNWKTLNEFNNAYFNVQYSQDGIHFENIGIVNSKAKDGNSSIPLNYTFTNQNQINGFSFYRLEQVDIDGKIWHSEIISLTRTLTTNSIRIYPNPTYADFFIESEIPVNISITDINGQTVFEKNQCTNTAVTLNHTGLYIIKLTDKQGQQTIRKIILQ